LWVTWRKKWVVNRITLTIPDIRKTAIWKADIFEVDSRLAHIFTN